MRIDGQKKIKTSIVKIKQVSIAETLGTKSCSTTKLSHSPLHMCDISGNLTTKIHENLTCILSINSRKCKLDLKIKSSNHRVK